MTKKLLPYLLAILLVFTTFGTALAAPLFKDVGDNYWAKAELDFLIKRGIIIGNSTANFGVNEEIRRLEASEMLIKALKLDTNNRPALNFIDIKQGEPGYAIISTIVDEGIMNGTAEGEFKPNDNLTRAQMAAILARAFDLKGSSASDFRDVSAKHWASSFIKTLSANEITTGYSDNTYKPAASITRAQFSVFLARILNPDFKQPIACYKPDNSKIQTVNVAVTTLWKEPNKARTVDRPSTTNVVDIAKWTKNMTLQQKQGLVGKIETQALYGQEVVILKSSGDWVQIAVKEQTSPKNKAGYPGWVPKAHITESYPNYKDCKVAIISTPTAPLYNDAKTTSEFMDISFNTSLPVIKDEAGWLHVQTPADGVKFIRKQDVEIYKNKAAIPKPTQKDIIDTAKKFTGLAYLWAGTSGFGLDCSGFTYSVYKQHGIAIPRDSTVQAVNGTPVLLKNLQPGDLLFFAHQKGKGPVHHVGMYIGNGQMIHSPNPKKSVEIISINTAAYKSEFSGARRYLK
ncbi:S-layer homology domain-containing protein [Sporosarcina limicola]|uniref:Cell wall-associated NlpC family hydrolase n=1 Tax=Sporosarcina limicola TaxID=34101 RepID=A0A927MK14_9BACL|nr:S-layer homology domain-containing protein [Sporosarcina limicola]MBE1555358.1 cell wall-associated NlpC family hydrolase [Sporosarcina limicola]